MPSSGDTAAEREMAEGATPEDEQAASRMLNAIVLERYVGRCMR